VLGHTPDQLEASHANTESSIGYSGHHSFPALFLSCASAGASAADITFARLGEGTASGPGYPGKDHGGIRKACRSRRLLLGVANDQHL